MSPEMLGAIITGIGICLSFCTLAFQIHMQVRQMKATTSIQLSSRLDQVNILMFNNLSVFDELAQAYHPLPDGRQAQAEIVMDLQFTLYDEIYTQYYAYQLITPETWEVWKKALALLFAYPFVQGYWRASVSFYSPLFVHEINTHIVALRDSDDVLLATLLQRAAP